MSDLLLAGCGQMGKALLRPWLEKKFFSNVAVIEPYAGHLADLNITALKSVDDYQGAAPDVLVLAVKPQGMKEALPPYQKILKPDTLVVTIAAGLALSSYQAILGTDQPVVRIMPNTPAMIGQGMSAGFASHSVTDAQKQLAARMFEAVGQFAWIDSEDLMDAVTLVSGSGPAYVFLLAEMLAKAGENAGLPAGLSALLARQTIAGGGAMLAATDDPPETLRRNVTSPGGVTAAALSVLMNNDTLQSLFNDALLAGIARSHELAKLS